MQVLTTYFVVPVDLVLTNLNEVLILWLGGRKQLSKALNVSKRSVDRDLDVYRNLLSKLAQGKELIKEYVDRWVFRSCNQSFMFSPLYHCCLLSTSLVVPGSFSMQTIVRTQQNMFLH